MTTDGNKAIVLRFIKEVLSGGNIDLIDELLAPDYMNPSMGVTNRTGFKAVISGLKASAPARDFEIADVVAEGEFGRISRQHECHPLQWQKGFLPELSPITVSLTERSWKMNR